MNELRHQDGRPTCAGGTGNRRLASIVRFILRRLASIVRFILRRLASIVRFILVAFLFVVLALAVLVDEMCD